MVYVECPGCRQPMLLRESRFGPFYGCPNFPSCDFKIGCHPGTTDPLGTPADGATRKARIAAHDAFDQLWHGQFRIMDRAWAYRMLAQKMGIPDDACHIGKMSAEQCAQVVEIAEEWLAEWVGEVYPAEEWGDLGSEV